MFLQKTIKALVLFSIVTSLSMANAVDEKKDCIECSYNKLAGAPDTGSLDKLAKVAKTRLLTEDEVFLDYLKSYCMKFEQVSHSYGFKRDMIEGMKKTPYSIDRYWTSSGCTPSRIGGTTSPIVHLIADDASGRNPFMETLYKYYQDKNDNDTWLKVVNAKNSRGHTILDYIDNMNNRKELIEEERESVNYLIKFLCDRGAVFSFSNKKCPMSI